MKAIKAFSKAGWIPHRQVGSHVVLRKEGSKVTLSIPKYKELKPGLLRHLVTDLGLKSAGIGMDAHGFEFLMIYLILIRFKRSSLVKFCT
jgi:predicted RNA binding protein YcfA (HicA-like mRNA interferase family)